MERQLTTFKNTSYIRIFIILLPPVKKSNYVLESRARTFYDLSLNGNNIAIKASITREEQIQLLSAN